MNHGTYLARRLYQVVAEGAAEINADDMINIVSAMEAKDAIIATLESANERLTNAYMNATGVRLAEAIVERDKWKELAIELGSLLQSHAATEYGSDGDDAALGKLKEMIRCQMR